MSNLYVALRCLRRFEPVDHATVFAGSVLGHIFASGCICSASAQVRTLPDVSSRFH